jgi:hypothetical protein
MAPAPHCVIWAYLWTCASKLSCIVGAYLLTCIVGHFVVAGCLWAMRRRVLKEANRPPFSDWIGLFGGATERFVALTLVLMAPAYLPTFIGGWVLLKFAIGWQRERNDERQPGLILPPGWKHDRQVAMQSFLALIGSVLSFSMPSL